MERFRWLGGELLEWRGRAITRVAQDRLTGGTVMIKLAPTSQAQDLRTEADALADLRHPGLLRLLERFEGLHTEPLGEVSGLVTRWEDGEQLLEGLREASVEARVDAFVGLLPAVDYLHRRGLLHLDIKPQNIILGDGGRTVLLDLGSARPVDSGPGEAGGTLGFAAPEVLAGEAASVASDIYSLGSMLYWLLTGQGPHGPLEPEALRDAVARGEIIPVRALCPHTPRPLARLVEQALATQPAERPASVVELARRLRPTASLGSRGWPPFVGRLAELTRLRSWLSQEGGGVLALAGPPGSGRARLLSRALLGGIPDRWAAGLVQADLISRLDSWDGGPLALGGRGIDPAQAERLAARGHRVVMLVDDSSAPVPTIRLAPLSLEVMPALGRFFGVTAAPRLAALHRRCGGWPGLALRFLQPRAPLGQVQGSASESAARSLAGALPPGIPRDVIEQLDPALRDGFAELVQQDQAVWGLGDRLYVFQTEDHDPALLSDELRRAVLGAPGRRHAAWRGLVALSLGAPAVEHLRAAWAAEGEDRDLLLLLAERMVSLGHRPARLQLARLREQDGDFAGASALLRELPDPDPEESCLLVRALRRQRRREEAVRVARAALELAPHAPTWIELALTLRAMGELDEAARACDAAEALDPDIASGDALYARVQIAWSQVEAGTVPPGLDGLLSRVEQAGEGIPAFTWSMAGTICLTLGQLERAHVLHSRALEMADEGADQAFAAGARLNLAVVLESLDRGQEARQLCEDALALARDAGHQGIEQRVRYTLADLELQAGRLPDAERAIAGFAPLVGEQPQVQVRLAELEARLASARGGHAQALERLEGVQTEGLDPVLWRSIEVVRARAWLALGDPQAAFRALEGLPVAAEPLKRAEIGVLRARCQLAFARAELSAARAQVPDHPPAIRRELSGQVLLAAAGEELDPASFTARRGDLDRAARLLRGDAASRAVALRERLLEGPGAALEAVIGLTEAMDDPQAFPEAVTRIVSEALGAYRVLIILPIPGMGRQVRWKELSGDEAFGLGDEVMRRIRRPDDVWLAEDAFADPALRASSQTVRTFELKSLLAVAIPQGDRACGALYVDDLHRAHRFGPADVRILQRLARAVGRFLPLLGLRPEDGALFDPADVYGVLLPNRERAREISHTLEQLSHRGQSNLLITGPTGAGKSVFAKRIATEVFGCSGFEHVVLRKADPQMLVTLLTGARRGEYTGAVDSQGAIQRCLDGDKVLFLDEVQNLDEAGQQILLPLLELPERHFGGLTEASRALPGDLHVLLGTNAVLDGSAWQDHFRPDLWYRMSRSRVHLPPLQERGAEAIYRYLGAMLAAEGVPAPEVVFEGAALRRVVNWGWPGNLRELASFAERAAGRFIALGRQIGPGDLVSLGVDAEVAPADAAPLAAVMRQTVLSALERAGWVQKDAARLLNRTPSWLSRYLKRHGLSDEVRRRRKRAER